MVDLRLEDYHDGGEKICIHKKNVPLLEDIQQFSAMIHDMPGWVIGDLAYCVTRENFSYLLQPPPRNLKCFHDIVNVFRIIESNKSFHPIGK